MSLYSLIYHEAYLILTPYLQEQRIEELNDNKLPDVNSALESLSKFIASELESTALDKAAIGRNEQRCSKTRKYKSKKKDEDGKREVFTATEVRKGYTRDKERYKDASDNLDDRYSQLEDLLLRLEKRELNEDDAELISEVLYINRWNFRLQVALISIALTIFVFGIVLSQLK